MCRPFDRKSADDDNKLESIFLRNPKDLFEERVIWKNNQYSIKYISITLCFIYVNYPFWNIHIQPCQQILCKQTIWPERATNFLFAAQPQYLSIETINAQIFCGNIILYIAVYQPFKKCIFFAWKIIAKKWERNITKQLLILLQYISTKIYFHHPQFNEFILIFKRDKLEDN